jgi:hypothetical protein
MRLTLHDPAYTDRLASFLTSVGQRPVIDGPDHVDLNESDDATDRAELEIYLRVWRVLYPDAAVELAAKD